MYLHLGQYTVVHTGDIVGIFDLDNSSVSRDRDGEIRVYVSQISSSTLRKRTGFVDGLSFGLPGTRK